MSSKCSPAQVVRACFAEVAKAVAHEHRLGLLERLAQGERSVDALAEIHRSFCCERFAAFAAVKARGSPFEPPGWKADHLSARQRARGGCLHVFFAAPRGSCARRVGADSWIVFRRSRRVGTGNAEATHQPIANGEGHAPRCEAKRRIRQGTHSQCSQYPAGRTRAAVERAATQSPDCGLLSRPLLRLVV